jgi:hypothetical protein
MSSSLFHLLSVLALAQNNVIEGNIIGLAFMGVAIALRNSPVSCVICYMPFLLAMYHTHYITVPLFELQHSFERESQSIAKHSTRLNLSPPYRQSPLMAELLGGR